MLHNEKFLSGNVDTYIIDENPHLFKFQPSQNRAQKLLHYLGNVMVNGSLTPLATTLKPAKVTPAIPSINAGWRHCTLTAVKRSEQWKQYGLRVSIETVRCVLLKTTLVCFFLLPFWATASEVLFWVSCVSLLRHLLPLQRYRKTVAVQCFCHNLA